MKPAKCSLWSPDISRAPKPFGKTRKRDMEAVVSMNAGVSFIQRRNLVCPSIQKVCFPVAAPRRASFSCLTRAAPEGEGSRKSIRLPVQAEGGADPVELVIGVPDEQGKAGQSRDRVTHVASESAVESPDRVHEEAKHEAGGIVSSSSGEAVEKVAGDLEHKAEQASEAEAENLGSEAPGLGQELQRNFDDAVKASFESGQKARDGFQVAQGEVEKRVSVLLEAAEEAGLRGNQVASAAKRSFDGLRERLGGAQASASRAAEDIQKNVEEFQRKIEEQVGKMSGGKEGSGVEKLRSEMEKGTESLGVDPEKHKAVDPESVNKDGEKKLVEQHRQSEKDDVGTESLGVDPEKHKAVDPESVNKDGEKKLVEQHRQSEKDNVVSEAIREHVDPALKKSAVRAELQEEPEIGDGNEHLKNMSDLVLQDAYAPIEGESD